MKCDRCQKVKPIVGIKTRTRTFRLGRRWSLTIEKEDVRFCASCLAESDAPVSPQMLQDIQDRLEEGER